MTVRDKNINLKSDVENVFPLCDAIHFSLNEDWAWTNMMCLGLTGI